MMDFRVGTGYDVHVFSKERKLIMGGLEITHEVGLLGHSDADVLLHAVSDALLGAAGLGDIGRYFPDTDMKYKDASSSYLLEQIVELLAKEGWQVNNIDATIIAQQPKMAPHIEKMCCNIAATCKVACNLVNVKATTHEKIGCIGREEGIAVQAIASIVRNK